MLIKNLQHYTICNCADMVPLEFSSCVTYNGNIRINDIKKFIPQVTEQSFFAVWRC